MLREEDHVHADEEAPEVQVAEELGVHPSAHLGEPVIEPGEEREHRTHRQNVVEVRDHELLLKLREDIEAVLASALPTVEEQKVGGQLIGLVLYN